MSASVRRRSRGVHAGLGRPGARRSRRRSPTTRPSRSGSGTGAWPSGPGPTRDTDGVRRWPGRHSVPHGTVRHPRAHGIRHRPGHLGRCPSAQVRAALELTASFLGRLGRHARRIFCPHGCASCLCRSAVCGAASIAKLAEFSPGCAHAGTAWCTGCPQDVHKPRLSRRASGHTVTH